MQEIFLWHFSYPPERIQGVLDGVPRGPVGPLGPLELAALIGTAGGGAPAGAGARFLAATPYCAWRSAAFSFQKQIHRMCSRSRRYGVDERLHKAEM